MIIPSKSPVINVISRYKSPTSHPHSNEKQTPITPLSTKNNKTPTELSISPFQIHRKPSNPNSVTITSHSQYSQIQPSPNPTHINYPIPTTTTPFPTPLPKSLSPTHQNHHKHPNPTPTHPNHHPSPHSTHNHSPHPLQFLGPPSLPNQCCQNLSR